MHSRKEYIKNVYAKYWLNAREKKYGFLEYDRHLCALINSLVGDLKGKNICEVAIGTGFPFGQYFDERGAYVYGVDISPELVEKCKKNNPHIAAEVADAENLPFQNSFFDLVYCFHSTWYFPDLVKAVSEMLRIAKSNGFVVFDFQNKNNSDIQNAYMRCVAETKGIGRMRRIMKNLAKIILNKGTPDWHFVIYETPTSPEDIYNMLSNDVSVISFDMFARVENDIRSLNDKLSFPEYDRLIVSAERK